MKINSAKFVKGAVGPDEVFEGHYPHIAFIGRSNVGKSSLINTLVNQKGLARTSSSPGSTRQINIFLINNSLYFIDLPGYGFAKASLKAQENLMALIYWYLFDSGYDQQRVVLIIDANVGPMERDITMLQLLEERKKDIIIVANKIDKIKKSQYAQHLQKIKNFAGNHTLVYCSSEKQTGINELRKELFGSTDGKR